MAIKKHKPTTLGRRGMTVTDYSVLEQGCTRAQACWSPTRACRPQQHRQDHRSPSRRRQPHQYRVIDFQAQQVWCSRNGQDP